MDLLRDVEGSAGSHWHGREASIHFAARVQLKEAGRRVRQLTEEHTDLDGREAEEHAEAGVEPQAVKVIADILLRDESFTPATKPNTAERLETPTASTVADKTKCWRACNL